MYSLNFNEEEAIPYLYNRLIKVAEKIDNYDLEFLFVNDGSKDNSLNLIKEYKKSDDRITYLSLSRNYGKEIAMKAAIDYVNSDVVVIMDADLQHPPASFVHPKRHLSGRTGVLLTSVCREIRAS